MPYVDPPQLGGKIQVEEKESVAAKVDLYGKEYSSLKERLDAEQAEKEQAKTGMDGEEYLSLKERFDQQQFKQQSLQDLFDTTPTNSEIGPLSELPTEDKSSFVNAMKEHSNQILNQSKKTGNIVSISQAPYNAKLDGVTDDSDAIINALNDVKEKGSGVVIVPYTSTGVLISKRFTIPKGVLLIGEGSPTAGYLSNGVKGGGIFTKAYFIMDGIDGSALNTTGSITAGQNTLTVASVIDFAVDQYITVIGAGQSGFRLDTKITAINGLVLTLQDNALTTIASAVVLHTPVFSIQDNAGMENFGFYYKTLDTNLTSGDVPTFPWTIYASGYGLHLKNLTSMGASHFISVQAFERGTIDGINGLVTKMGMRILRSRDVSRIKKIHFNPNITYPTQQGVSTGEGFSTYFQNLLKQNFIAWRMGSADIHHIHDMFTIFANKGMHIPPYNYSDGLGEVFDNYPFTMSTDNITIDNSVFPILVERPISFTMKMNNLEIVPMADDGSAVGIWVTGAASGLITITNFESKGTAAQTNKHVIVDSSGISIVDIKGARFVYPGNDNNRATFTDMFTVTGNNRLNAELFYSKTNAGGAYRSVYYSSDTKQFPTGLQINNYSLEEASGKTQFKIVQRDGGDNKYDRFAVDNIGGITGGFSQTIANGSTATYDLRGSGNANGRGKFIVMADFAGNAYVEGWSTGTAITAFNTGSNASTTQGNANTLNVSMISAGILTIQNNLGSDRTVSIMFFPASR